MVIRKSVGIRIEGTLEQTQEALRRLAKLFHFGTFKHYPNLQSPETPYTYLRAYVYEPDTLLNQLEASQAELQQLAEVLGEVEKENERLKQQLGQVPTPKSGDMVLGTKHRL